MSLANVYLEDSEDIVCESLEPGLNKNSPCSLHRYWRISQ